MGDTDSLQRFYKHTNDESEIGWKNASDLTIGPNLKGLLGILEYSLHHRCHIYQKEGGWSGDLYVVHRRLFLFQNEVSRFMGDSGAGGDLMANVYEVVINSVEGWAQYLSVVLKGPFDKDIAEKLQESDFAPKHSYLAKNDPIARNIDIERLWLDHFVELPNIPIKSQSKAGTKT